MSFAIALNRFIRIRKCLPLKKISCRQSISTSGKKREASAVINPESKTESEYVPDEKNWVSYGFTRNNETDDLNYMHMFFFFTISLTFVGCGFVITYRPISDRDWCYREAYLELRRREKLGLPPVDANYVQPDKIKLPTDEELGDTKIII